MKVSDGCLNTSKSASSLASQLLTLLLRYIPTTLFLFSYPSTPDDPPLKRDPLIFLRTLLGGCRNSIYPNPIQSNAVQWDELHSVQSDRPSQLPGRKYSLGIIVPWPIYNISRLFNHLNGHVTYTDSYYDVVCFFFGVWSFDDVSISSWCFITLSLSSRCSHLSSCSLCVRLPRPNNQPTKQIKKQRHILPLTFSLFLHLYCNNLVQSPHFHRLLASLLASVL